MIVKSLKLKNFRNYNLLNIEFDAATNIFCGDNAQGKTNILESIYLSGTTKSHRGTKDRDMIQFGHDEAHIETVVEKNGIPFQIDMHLKKNSPKGIAINKIPIRKASELFGIINIVFFSPEDLNIIKNGPAERRRFIDLELAQLDKLYLSDLSNYNRIINQRNKLLKDVYNRNDLLETLEIWDLQLIQYGNKIIERRKQFIGQVNEIISEVHRKLTGGREELKLYYEPGIGNLEFEKALLKNRERAEELKLLPLQYRSDTLVTFLDAAVCYGGNPVSCPVSFSIHRGERVVLDGSNGSGKSSLLKFVAGEALEHTGTITMGSGLVISYVPQDTSHLQGTLSDFAKKSQIEEALFKAILRKLDFERIQFEKEIQDFSGGQKKKVLIAKSLCEQAHLYVWDEPLNFVDLYSRMQIEQLIREFSPTMLLVEHDQAFREAVATKTVQIEGAENEKRN